MSLTPPDLSEQQGPPIRCDSCGYVNRPQGKFCSRCGHRLSHQALPSLHSSDPSVSPVVLGRPLARGTGSQPSKNPFIELWWIRLPTWFRHSSVLLSEIWRDGLYLSTSPLAATLLPLLLFFFGALEGMIHWNLITNPYAGEEALVPFTQLFPLLLLTAACSALSMNLGMAIVLGYALGDTLHTAFDVHHPALAEWYAMPQTAVLNIYVPHLLSYVIFALLAVIPTLCSKALAAWLSRLIHSPSLLVVAVGACIQGGLVSAWIQAAPLLIRTFWGWGWYSLNTTTAAMYYLQTPEMSNWIIWIAVIAFVVRNVLAYRASAKPSFKEREERLSRGFKEADAHPGVLRRFPPFLSALLPAGVATLVMGGILSAPKECLIFFLFSWFLLILRSTILPRFGFWVRWARWLSCVPIPVRLIGALLMISLVSERVITPAQSPLSTTFQPHLITTGISAIVVTILIPQARPAQTQPSENPIGQAKGKAPWRRRRGRQLTLGVCMGMGLFLLTAPAAYADNCGSIADCFSTAGAAINAAIGLGALISVLLSLGTIAGWTPNKQPSETKEGWWSKAGRFLLGVGEGLLPFGLVAGATALVAALSPVAAAVSAGALIASVIGYTYSHAPGPGVGDKVRSAFNAINPVSQVGEGMIGAQEAFNEGDYQEAGKQVANTALGMFGVFTLVSSLVRRAASALGLRNGATVEPPAPTAPEKELPLPIEGTQGDQIVRARSLLRRLAANGEEIIVNIGGTGAPHEPPHAINVNPNIDAPRLGIPNFVQERGEMIGTLFEAGTVDKVVGNRLLLSKLGLDEIAQGAYTILRSGGTFDMNFFPNADVNLMAEALQRAGFKNVKVELDLAVTASKP